MAGKESSAVAGNGGMVVVALREEENAEVSSEATTLHLGSPAKSCYVCPGGSSCENIDCPCDWPETEAEDVNEDVNAIARDLQTLHDTAQRWRDLAQQWKEAKDPKLGKVKGNGRSGGSAAPKKDRKARARKRSFASINVVCRRRRTSCSSRPR